jgi:hypothetical protein
MLSAFFHIHHRDVLFFCVLRADFRSNDHHLNTCSLAVSTCPASWPILSERARGAGVKNLNANALPVRLFAPLRVTKKDVIPSLRSRTGPSLRSSPGDPNHTHRPLHGWE